MYNLVFGPATLGALPAAGRVIGAVCNQVMYGVSK